jgi:hypothetical protein
VLGRIVALTMLIAGCAACRSTTNGIGQVHVGTRSPTAPAATAPGRIDHGVPAPATCATSQCALVARHDLGGGFRLQVLGNTLAQHGAGAAVLELTRRGTPVYWRVFDRQTPAALSCARFRRLPNCVLVDYVGAYGGVAYPIILVDGGVWIGAPVGTDTPTLRAADLDGDGRVDVYGLQNNYDPSYSDGAVQWQTWRRSADGTSLTSTGCGVLSHDRAPAPVRLLTGACEA